MGSKTQNDASPKIVQLCLDIIRPYLQGDGKFTKDEIPETRYCLMSTYGNYCTGRGSHGQSVPILKMTNGFFIYCSMVFREVNRKKILKGISLQFFDESKLLFRAEWDNKDFLNIGDAVHSQPHWHLDAKGEIKKGQVARTFSEYQTMSRFDNTSNMTQEETKHINMGRMHFFMSLETNKVEQAYYQDLTDDKRLTQWLSQCLKSVDYELRFISTKV